MKQGGCLLALFLSLKRLLYFVECYLFSMPSMTCLASVPGVLYSVRALQAPLQGRGGRAMGRAEKVSPPLRANIGAGGL